MTLGSDNTGTQEVEDFREAIIVSLNLLAHK